MTMDFTDAVNDHIKGAIAQLYTTIPAIVTNISRLESDNVVSVQPAINKTSSDGFSYPMAEIPDVPVQWPAGGGAVLTFPIAKGDDVLLVCTMASIAEWWLVSSGAVTPFDQRMHDLSDCIVIPSIFRKANNPAPSKDDVVLKYGGHSIKLEKAGGNIVISSDTPVIVNSDLEVNGNISATGEITAASTSAIPISMTTHIHTGNLGAPTTAPIA